jgi:UDP-glucuronate 4-epimerase
LRVLVTGGAGAIGSFVVEALLARGDEVAVLDSFHDFYPRARKERNLEAARAHAGFAGVCEGDIRDSGFVTSSFARHTPQACIHLAARAGVGPSLLDPVGYADVNVLGTAIVLNAAARRSGARVASSSVSRAPRCDQRDIRQTGALAYATKPRGELLCHAAHASAAWPSRACAFSRSTVRASGRI